MEISDSLIFDKISSAYNELFNKVFNEKYNGSNPFQARNLAGKVALQEMQLLNNDATIDTLKNNQILSKILTDRTHLVTETFNRHLSDLFDNKEELRQGLKDFEAALKGRHVNEVYR